MNTVRAARRNSKASISQAWTASMRRNSADRRDFRNRAPSTSVSGVTLCAMNTNGVRPSTSRHIDTFASAWM